MSNALNYFICHIDVYQGKNRANTGIIPMLQHLPTTQKAVANSIVCSIISCYSKGYYKVIIVNRYSSIELAVFLRENVKYV